MQNVNFYKKFNIHHMITESHLPVIRYKSYILYYRVHNQGSRAILQGDQKTSSYAVVAVCRAATIAPLLDSPILGKVSLLRLGSQNGDRVTLPSC